MKLRCPDCRQAFPWDPAAKWPQFCPVNGCDIGHDRADDDIVMPSINTARSALKHDVYRQMEQASEHRMHAAAEAAGVPVSEMSNMKMTNMNDRRDCEIAEAPVTNSVTQQMDRMKQVNPNADVGFGSNGAEFAAGTASGAVTVNGQTFTGISPRAGMNALGNIRRMNGTA